MSSRTPAFRLYLITDRSATNGRDLAALLETTLSALPRGIAAVQVREKDLSGRGLFDLVSSLVPVAHRHGAPLLVNDRMDVARAAGADGVHLGTWSLRPPDIRHLWPQALIGVSTHSLQEAREVTDQGADFVTFGPVFPTPSKAPYGPPQGLAKLAEVVDHLAIPVFGLGGIGPVEAAAVAGTGAGIALIRGVMAAADPAQAARELATALRP